MNAVRSRVALVLWAEPPPPTDQVLKLEFRGLPQIAFIDERTAIIVNKKSAFTQCDKVAVS